jgi:hypothetical protein
VPKFAEGWTAGREPDYILEMPIEFSIPAEGELGVQMFYYAGAVHRRSLRGDARDSPSNRSVVHHAGVFVVDIPEGAKIVEGRLVMPDGKASTDRGQGCGRADVTALPGANKLLSWVPGRGVDSHRADIGKRIPAGKYINWQMHYNPIGKPQTDRTRLGIWFNKVPVTHEAVDPAGRRSAGDDQRRAVAVSRRGQGSRIHRGRGSTRRRSKTPNIPPYAEDWSLTGITPVTEDITLYAMSPHMHLRGKSLKWVIVYPTAASRRSSTCRSSTSTGRSSTSWNSRCTSRPAARFSASASTTTRRRTSGIRRRTCEVYWSEQSWDEMYQPFTLYSVDSQTVGDLTVTKSSHRNSSANVRRKISKRSSNASSGERASQEPARTQRQPEGQRKGRRVRVRSRTLSGHALQRAVGKLLAMADEIRAFIKEHDAELKAKPEA